MPISTTSIEPLSVADYLASYQASSSLFASPSTSILAQGTALSCRTNNRDGQLLARIRQLLHQAERDGLKQPIILGAIPFNPHKNGFFRVPRSYELAGPLRRSSSAGRLLSSNTVQQHRLIPNGAHYEQIVSSGLRTMAEQHISKLVLARGLQIDLEQALDRHTVLSNMLQSNPAGYTYCLPLERDEHHPDPETFLGASPELLIKRIGDQVMVNPLAGTCARDPRPDVDQAQAQQLLQSDKDRREHAFVIDEVVRILQLYCTDLQIPTGPSLTHTRNLWHLSTHISGRLRQPHVSSLELALAMHPTPAVCGTPTHLAMQAIEQLEPVDRQLFAGAIGWSDAAGNGEWAVAIRCAHYRERTLTLSAGAGIVPGSEPALERLETGNKLMTLLSALGLTTTIDTL